MGENEAVGAEEWQLRASAWELAALSFRYPGEELCGAVASGEWLDAAREVAAALGLALPGDFGAGVLSSADVEATLYGMCCDPETGVCHTPEPAPSAEDVRRELRPEATRLFVGAPTPVCSPYEGVWRAKDDGVQPLLFVNPHTMDVERFCKACGLGQPEGTNEPLDAAATECELLEHLALRAAGTPADGLPAEDALPDGSAAAAYGRFLAEHARTWMPRFCEAVATESRAAFFRAAAQYLGALVAAEVNGVGEG